MTPAEFAAAWSPSSLVRPSSQAVAARGLSPATAGLLLEAGLPESADPGFAFSFPGGAIPTLAELSPPPRGLKREWLDRYLCLGGSTWMKVCLDREQEGRVVQLVENDPPGFRFVNSSLPQLAESLLAYREILTAAVAEETQVTRASIAAAVALASRPPADRAQAHRGRGGDDTRQARQQADEAEDHAALARLQAFREAMARIDPPALAGTALWGQMIQSRIDLGGLSEDRTGG